MSTKEHFHFEDFILDDSFRQYVEKSDRNSVEFWEKWISQHPESASDVKRATDVLHTLISHKKQDIISDKHAALKVLFKNIEQLHPAWSVRKIYITFAKAAAFLAIATGLVWLGHSFKTDNQAEPKIVGNNEIIVPVGEKSQVILSDGTHIWINSGSRFTYPVDFGQNSREVTLEGEAYFDVTRKGKTTFVVNTPDAKIRVLGTTFNVKAYPEDKKTQTTVVKGLVSVESKIRGSGVILIRPDEMAVANAEEGKRKRSESETGLKIIQNVNTPAITSWKDQMLVFADETFGDIAIKMERWFNTRIIIEDEKIIEERYTGKFVHNETVYEVLKAIQLTTPIEYTISNNEIIIRRKK